MRQSANPYPLTLLGSYVGASEDECIIHSMLSVERRQGEWFRLDATLARVIAMLCRKSYNLGNEAIELRWHHHRRWNEVKKGVIRPTDHLSKNEITLK